MFVKALLLLLLWASKPQEKKGKKRSSDGGASLAALPSSFISSLASFLLQSIYPFPLLLPRRRMPPKGVIPSFRPTRLPLHATQPHEREEEVGAAAAANPDEKASYPGGLLLPPPLLLALGGRLIFVSSPPIFVRSGCPIMRKMILARRTTVLISFSASPSSGSKK